MGRLLAVVGLIALAGVANAQLLVTDAALPSTPDPSVAMAANGTFVVVWHRFDGIFGQRYDAAGQTLGAPFEVSSAPFAGAAPAVGMAPDGRFVVAWEEGSPVVARRYDAAGVAQGAEFQVNTTPGGAHVRPRVAFDGAGNFVIVWYFVIDQTVLARRYDTTGTAQGPDQQVNVTQPSFPADVVFDAGGNFMVVWETGPLVGSEIVGRGFDPSGTPLGGEFQVNSVTTGFQSYPSIVATAGSDFAVVWQGPASGGGYGTRVRILDDVTGTPLTAEAEVAGSAGSSIADVAADATGRFVVAWHTDYERISWSRFDGTGMALESAIDVPLRDGDFYRPGSGVAMASDGRFVIAWDEVENYYAGLPRAVFATRYDADGIALDDRIMTGKKLVLKDPGDPARRRVVFVSKQKSIDTTPLSALDPVANGASLHVYNANGSMEEVCFDLPASNWVASGDPLRPKFKYVDTTGAAGPCKVAKVTPGKILKVLCTGATQPITYTLDEPTQGSMGVRFESGLARYCTAFGPSAKKDEPGRFVATDASLVNQCPPAPGTCP
jgi:hypothetical protein